MRKLLLIIAVLSVAHLVVCEGSAASVSVESVSLTLSASQLQHLKSSPVQLLAAPGVGQMINVLSVVAQYKAGGVPYTVVNGSQLNLFLGDPTNVVVAGGNAYGFLDQSTNQVQVLSQAAVNNSQGSYENQPLMVANNSGSEWAAGDGTVTITVYYTLVTLQ